MWMVCRRLWVLCSGHGVSKWGQQSNKLRRASVENRSQIYENPVLEPLRIILGRGWRQERAPGVKGRLKDLSKVSFLNEKVAQRIKQWMQDRHQYPLKTVSASGFEKNMKKHMKNNMQNERSGSSKVIANVGFTLVLRRIVIELILFTHSQTCRKTDAKRDLTSHVF